MARASRWGERQTAASGSAPNGDPEPDVAIRKAVGILARARRGLDGIGYDNAEIAALLDALYEADAELSLAAWEVGLLKSRINEARRSSAEMQAKLAMVADTPPTDTS